MRNSEIYYTGVLEREDKIENEPNQYLNGYWQLLLVECNHCNSCYSYKQLKALKNLETMKTKLIKISESREKFRSRLWNS